MKQSGTEKDRARETEFDMVFNCDLFFCFLVPLFCLETKPFGEEMNAEKKTKSFLFYSTLFYSVFFFPVLCPLPFQAVVPLTDLLAQFDELHLCWHVSHGPHTLPQVFVTNVAFFVPVKLHERLTEF